MKTRKWEEMYEKIQEKVVDVIEGEPFVSYSAYKTDLNGIPTDNLELVVIKGNVQFFQKHEIFWGEGKDYMSPVISNPTWLQITILANDMIKITGDKHHIFLENFDIIKEENGIKQVEFIMGS